MEKDQLKKELLMLEDTLLQPSVRKSAQELALLLADEFKEFGGSGRTFTKQQIIDQLPAEIPIKMTISEFELNILAPEVVHVTYRLMKHDERKQSLRSSIWKWRESRWQMVFHQGTPTETL